MKSSFLLIQLALLLALTCSAQGQSSIFGVPTDELIDASPDGWDLTVVITQPIEPGDEADGQTDGTVESWNYYASDLRDVTEFTVRPLLVKNEDDFYTIVGIGEAHEPEESGPQEDVPFNLEDGTNAVSIADDDVTFHIAFIGQRPDFGNDDAGGIIPFSADSGPGMFGMNTLPDTEFLIDDEVENNHASAEDGRNYQFNFNINWGGEVVDPDVDGDGMRTVWEEKYDLDPNDPSDAGKDLDHDGLTNLREFEEKLIPNDPDKDKDGRLDGVELGALILDSDQAVPAPDLGDATPIGFAFVTVNSDTRMVEIAGTYSGMTSAVSAAHLHGLGAPGATADVLITLTASGGTEGSISGSGVLTETEFAGLVAGQTYINVHTANNGDGEIRSQVPIKVDLTDPKNPDTDGDSLLDGVETNTGTFVDATDTGTDPNNVDTDGDGFKDGTEIARGTDPTDPASKPVDPGIPDPQPEFGSEDWIDGIGNPDGWDLTVVFTSPIEPPAEFAGETSGTVEYINYYFSEARPEGEHTVAPILVKYIEDDDEYIVAGVGEMHVAEETGPQERVPFLPVSGTNEIDLTEEGVTWHAAAYQGHPDAGNNSAGAVIPFGTDGAGMFGYDNGPDEQLEEGQVLTSGHASEEGGRHYAFNFGINWGGGGPALFEITRIAHSGTETEITWNSRNSKEYSIEFREDLAQGVWIELDDGVVSEGDSTSFTDDDAGRAALADGYYRVREN